MKTSHNRSTKTIYLLRHGESVDNARPIFQSSASALSKKGIEQCLKTAKILQNNAIKLENIISSTLPRAVESAQLINDSLKLPLQLSDDLVERRSPTSVQGQKYTDPKAANTWAHWDKSFYENEKVEDGEISSEIVARAKKFLISIQENAQSNTLVLTHGYFLRVIVATALIGDVLGGRLLDTIQKGLMTDNMAMTVLTYSEDYKGEFGWKIKSYNCTLTEGTQSS